MVYSLNGDTPRTCYGATLFGCLRRKLLESFDQGNGSLSELAERFSVSLGWAWKVSAARKRTGRMELCLAKTPSGREIE